MSTDPHPDASHDPVNRWATEHYGFDDEPAEQAAASTTRPPHGRPARPHPRRLLLAAGALGLALGLGVGGNALAAGLPDGGSDRHPGSVVQVDRLGGGPDVADGRGGRGGQGR